MHDRTREIGARVGYRAALGLTMITDLLPPRLRFGHWQRVLDLLAVRGGLPVVPRSQATVAPADDGSPLATRPPLYKCLVVTGSLDGGGVEAVVSALARGLPRHGFSIEVACSAVGRVSRELQASGVLVSQVSAHDLPALIATRRPDVIQLHRIDRALITPLIDTQAPVVPLFHAMESYLDEETWSALETLTRRSPLCVAVSDGVRAYFTKRLAAARIRVVVNGVRLLEAASTNRQAARETVGHAIGAEIHDDDVVIVALQRFSDQKNAAGLVDAFLRAQELDPRLRLIVAGAPDNWLEVLRADLLRRGHPDGARVHLLGDSDPWTVLNAGDLYALDSFAEGGPLSAVEAATCGLPLVLSDVGFARELVAADGVHGECVSRANADASATSIARQRRKRHQNNLDEFSQALVRTADLGRTAGGSVPEPFTEDAMLRGHAMALMDAISGSEAKPYRAP